MKIAARKTLSGYILIEALVAVLIVALGMLGLTRLEAQIVGSAGEAKARSTATALARSQIESLRNAVLVTQFPPTPVVATSPATITRDGVAFTMTWNLTQPDTTRNDRLARVVVTWIDRAGGTQTVSLNSIVAWNDPALGAMTQQNLSKNIIAPTGAAKRGSGAYRPGQTTQVQDGANQTDKITRLLDANGNTILSLDPTPNGTVQRFTEIHGRVYFDNSVSSNQLPDPDKVYVRLSSEGECVYDHAVAHLQVLPANATGNAIKYQYFSYTCYVGPGWYGNVGVSLINDNSSPTICVGDPMFTNTSFTATPAATESTTRSYRGFRAQTVGNVTTYISTGVQGGGFYGDDGSTVTTKAGKPQPFDYPSTYTWVTSSGSPNNFFNQDFLISKITGNGTCAGQMSQIANANTFSPNAGKYYCINPDDWTADNTGNQCPTTWPGFNAAACAVTVSGSFTAPAATLPTGAVGSSSATTMTCSVTDNSGCSCQTTTGTANYTCATSGGASQTISIAATKVTTALSASATSSCIPAAFCTAPANTSTAEYQCAQSACTSGVRTQSRTVAKTWSSWTAVATYNTTTGNNGVKAEDACKAAKPTDTSTTEYQCVVNTNVSGSKQWFLESRNATITYGQWTDMTNTCSSTKPDDTSTSVYTWGSSTGCPVGTQQVQEQQVVGTPITQTCSRTSGNLGCTSPSGFNIDTAAGATCI